MKRIIFLLILVCGTMQLMAQPKIEFSKTIHDYGKIAEEGGPAESVFEFTNKGNAPLIVTNAVASCGCTTPTWTKEPIPPGKKGTIKVSYDPKNRAYPFTKTVNVYSNTQPSITVLTIKGDVTPRKLSLEEEYPRENGPIRWKTNNISFGTMVNTEVKTEILEYINNSTTPVKLGVHSSPKHISLKFEPETVQPGKTGIVNITYDASKTVNIYGVSNERAYFTINDVKNSDYSIYISVAINEDFSKLTPDQLAKAPILNFDKTVFDFGTIKEGDKVSTVFKISNTGKTDLILRAVRPTCGCTAVKHANVVSPGQTIDLNVEFNSAKKKGRQTKTITIVTNDPKKANTQLRIIGTVTE